MLCDELDRWGVVAALLLSHVWLFMTPWTVACPAPLSMGFPRQEYLSGIFPTQGLSSHLQHWQVDSLPLSRLEKSDGDVGESLLIEDINEMGNS